MNKFETGVRKARAQQIRLYGFLVALLFLAGLALAGMLVFASGTSIDIQPTEPSDTGELEVSTGAAIAIGRVVYSLTGEMDIAVSAPGFKSETRTIRAAEKGTVVVVRLEPLPGEISIRTVPARTNTGWFVDDRHVWMGETLHIEVAPGRYNIEIDHPYFDLATLELKIGRGEKTDLVVDLVPVLGRLLVDSSPPNSAVIIDGNEAARTPASINLEGGKYQIEIMSEGFSPTIDTIEISNTAREQSRNYRLKPLTASLAFLLDPQGGTLLVNGSKTNPNQQVTVTANSENTITYMLDGYFPLTKKVVLEAAENQTVTMYLQPENGLVDIDSQPSAAVFVNNVMAGNTPVTLSLPAVGVTVSLRKEGYRSIEKALVPTSKRDLVIRETLQTELAARLAESPQAYENSVGSAMLLFLPTDYQMGAPRHDKGQRANEFQRNISLVHPFYAAKHEVSQKQYALFNPGRTSRGDVNNPVASVSWLESASFCNWLSDKEGLKPFYILNESGYRGVNSTADGYRMLTEAEWEWLARLAAKRDRTTFTWGDANVVPAMAGNIADETARGLERFYIPNYTDNFAGIAPVGSFPAEPSGLFDMTGNVSEWVNDYYSLEPPLSDTLEVDPLGPPYGDSHVVKGSNWQSGTRTTLRAAYRDGALAGRENLGFRIGRYLYGGKIVAEID